MSAPHGGQTEHPGEAPAQHSTQVAGVRGESCSPPWTPAAGERVSQHAIECTSCRGDGGHWRATGTRKACHACSGTGWETNPTVIAAIVHDEF